MISGDKLHELQQTTVSKEISSSNEILTCLLWNIVVILQHSEPGRDKSNPAGFIVATFQGNTLEY